MDRQQATEFVLKEFKRQRHRNDIIMELCQKTGASWEQGQRFVQKVEVEHRQEITASMTPLLIMIGGAIILGGLGAIAYAVIYTLEGTLFGLPGIPIPGLGNIVYPITGLAMIAGGTIGILRALRQLTNRP
jgi:hypothetical protein